jgi:FAD/FMN-containing dehydrogenase
VSQMTTGTPESNFSRAARSAALRRRGFVGLAGAAAVAGIFPPIQLQEARVAGPGKADWEALRRKLSTHDLIQPGQRGYSSAKELFDPRFDGLRPAGIAYCGKPADVQACLAFVRKFKLAVRARSGGHSYAGWSSVTGGLIVDVSRMSSFSASKGSVRAGAGIALIDFYSRLAARGLAVPGGSCPTVGIAGLALGGGVGVVGRRFGLTSDNLEAVQIVTASGAILNCDAKHSNDLFWACRGGGGGNFGIATSFTFRAHPLRSLVLFFLYWPWSQAARVVDAWQNWAPHAPDALWSNLHLGAATGQAPAPVFVGGTYIGGLSGAERLLNDLYQRAGSRPSGAPFPSTYLNAMLIEAGCTGKTVRQCHTGPGGLLPRVPELAKSDFFTRKLDAAGIRTLLNGIESLRQVHGAQHGSGGIALDAFGGALNRVHPDATAFVHRNALFLGQYTTGWTSPGSATGISNQHAWLRSFYAKLHPFASGQAYQNYIDPDLTDWRTAYYGANYARLSQIKKKYDPTMLFSFPQAITF